MSEDNNWRSSAESFLRALSQPTPTPGGGSASAVAGAMACALGRMALGISIESKKVDEARKENLRHEEAELGTIMEGLLSCAADDAMAFQEVMGAYRMPKDNSERPKKIQAALKLACDVPFKTARLSLRAFGKLEALHSTVTETVVSDLNIGSHLARAAVRGSFENVRINLPSIKDENYRQAAERAIAEIEKELG